MQFASDITALQHITAILQHYSILQRYYSITAYYSDITALQLITEYYSSSVAPAVRYQNILTIVTISDFCYFRYFQLSFYPPPHPQPPPPTP